MNRPKFYSNVFRVNQQVQSVQLTINSEKVSLNLCVGGQQMKDPPRQLSNCNPDSTRLLIPHPSQLFVRVRRPVEQSSQQFSIKTQQLRMKKPATISEIMLSQSTVGEQSKSITQSVQYNPNQSNRYDRMKGSSELRTRVSQKQIHQQFPIVRSVKSQSNSPEKRKNRGESNQTIRQNGTLELNKFISEKTKNKTRIKIGTDLSENEDDNSNNQSQSCKSESDHSFNEITVNQNNTNVPMILLSQYPGRPATVFLQYPPMCENRRSTHGARKMTEQEQKQYQLSYRVQGQIPYKCVTSAFENAGFVAYNNDDEEEENNWNVHWGMANKTIAKNMNRNQKINHFPGCWNLGRKDNLWMNLSKMKRKFPIDYDYFPNTYLMAYDYDRFICQKDLANNKQLWILKPCNAARGKGIRMISKKSKITKKKNYLIMDYISKPHLINNLKYDLRIYVLVTGFDPLRIYIYNEGLARFATQEYSLEHKDLTKKYIHLTNFSVNKNNPAFIKNQKSDADDFGSKWSLNGLRRKYESLGINYKQIFLKIQDVVIKTIIASEPFMLDMNAKSQEHKNSYFELYGFDVLIDKELKPWVLEVNVCPSLNSSSPLDKKIKTSLISDVLHLVGIPLWDKTKTKQQSTIGSPNHKQFSLFSRNLNDIPSINFSNCQNKLTPDDLNVLYTVKEESQRCGNFECIFPKPETMQFYSQFFQYPRYNNNLIGRFFEDGQRWLEKKHA